ncbi:MAG TPA: DUF2970 domain-containing protein [Burkholderiales bacterium]
MKVKSSLSAASLQLFPGRWPRGRIAMETAKTVLAGAIGIRSCRAALRANPNPIYVLIAAIIFAVLFVSTLLTIVHIVTS